MGTIRLHRPAATALLAEAHDCFDNAVEEVHSSGDESQRPAMEACVEIIGRLKGKVARWPGRKAHGYWEDNQFCEFELSTGTLDWLLHHRDQQAGYVEDMDENEACTTEPGYMAEQVFVLHVLSNIARQRKQVAV